MGGHGRTARTRLSCAPVQLLGRVRVLDRLVEVGVVVKGCARVRGERVGSRTAIQKESKAETGLCVPSALVGLLATASSKRFLALEMSFSNAP